MKIHQAVTKLLGRAKARGWQHWRKCFALLVVGVLVSLWFEDTTYLLPVRTLMTQFLVNLSHFKTTPRQITLVPLDDAVFYGVNHGRNPIAPSVFEQVILHVIDAHVRVIVLDLDFSDPFALDSAHRDSEYEAQLNPLKALICEGSKQAHFVLPLALARDGKSVKPSLLMGLPCDTNAITAGIINFSADLGHVQLGIYDKLTEKIVPSLPIAIARAVPYAGRKERVVETTVLSDLAGESPVVPFLEKNAIPSLPASRLLSLGSAEAHDKLSEVVIITGQWHVGTPDSGLMVDTHQTPLGPRAGAFIQAAQAEGLLEQRLYWPLASSWIVLGKILWLCSLALVFGCTERTSLKVAAVVIAVSANLIAAWFLTDLGMAVDVAVPFTMVIVHPVLDQIVEWRDDAFRYRQEHHAQT